MFISKACTMTQTELNVVFLCQEYEQKEWCRLECHPGLIKQRRNEIMFLRFDNATVSGVFSIDGYIDIQGRGDPEVATLILERHAQRYGGASVAKDGRPLVLQDAGKLPNGRTQMCELVLGKGERIHVQLEAEHELDFAVCAPNDGETRRS
jgi:hypothetical protein